MLAGRFQMSPHRRLAGKGTKALWGHIRQRPSRVIDVVDCQLRRACTREVEIEQHRAAVGGEQDVRRFHVPMSDVFGESVINRLGQTSTDPRHGVLEG